MSHWCESKNYSITVRWSRCKTFKLFTHSPDIIPINKFKPKNSVNCFNLYFNFRLCPQMFKLGVTFARMFKILIKIQCKCIEIRNQKWKLKWKWEITFYICLILSSSSTLTEYADWNTPRTSTIWMVEFVRVCWKKVQLTELNSVV